MVKSVFSFAVLWCLCMPFVSGTAMAGAYDAMLIPLALGGKEWYVKPDGTVALPHCFEAAGEFADNGLAAVCEDGKCGYITVTGDWAISPQFERTEKFAPNGLARVLTDEKYGYIDATGAWIIEPYFSEASDFSGNGLAVAYNDDKAGFINAAGEWAIAPQFDSAQSFADNGLALVSFNEKQGVIDASGKWVAQAEYDEILPFSANGLALAAKDMVYGYINTAGEVGIPLQFALVEETFIRFDRNFAANGLAMAEDPETDRCGYINSKGEWVVQPVFAYADGFESNGLARASDGNGWGYINALGQWVVPPHFSWVGSFSEGGTAFAYREEDETYVILNEKGVELVNANIARQYGFAGPDIAFVEKNDGYSAYMTVQGKLLYEEDPNDSSLVRDVRGDLVCK